MDIVPQTFALGLDLLKTIDRTTGHDVIITKRGSCLTREEMLDHVVVGGHLCSSLAPSSPFAKATEREPKRCESISSRQEKEEERHESDGW